MLQPRCNHDLFTRCCKKVSRQYCVIIFIATRDFEARILYSSTVLSSLLQILSSFCSCVHGLQILFPYLLSLLAILQVNFFSKIKVKAEYSCSWETISELRGIICHIGSHSVTCHLLCALPELQPERPVLDLPTPERLKVELT